jgi:hypothetical protein
MFYPWVWPNRVGLGISWRKFIKARVQIFISATNSLEPRTPVLSGLCEGCVLHESDTLFGPNKIKLVVIY